MMRLGIFGGTFDPPHIGHMIIAMEAQYQLKLSHILFILTANPPHKTDQFISPVEYRLRLLQAAIKGVATFEISRVDIDRSPPYYSIDTLRIIRERFPETDLVFIMGGDSLVDLPTWHDPVGFVESCNVLAVYNRPNYPVQLSGLEKLIPGIAQKVFFIKAPLLDISSTEVRKRIKCNQPYQFYIPPSVYTILQKENPYQ